MARAELGAKAVDDMVELRWHRTSTGVRLCCRHEVCFGVDDKHRARSANEGAEREHGADDREELKLGNGITEEICRDRE